MLTGKKGCHYWQKNVIYELNSVKSEGQICLDWWIVWGVSCLLLNESEPPQLKKDINKNKQFALSSTDYSGQGLVGSGSGNTWA